jgi:hypothetical protein
MLFPNSFFNLHEESFLLIFYRPFCKRRGQDRAMTDVSLTCILLIRKHVVGKNHMISFTCHTNTIPPSQIEYKVHHAWDGMQNADSRHLTVNPLEERERAPSKKEKEKRASINRHIHIISTSPSLRFLSKVRKYARRWAETCPSLAR